MWQCVRPRRSADDEWRTIKNKRAECIIACRETTIDVSLKNADRQGSSGGVDVDILTD